MISKILIFIIFSQICLVELSHSSNNHHHHQADKYCGIKKINYLINYSGHDILYGKVIGLKCDIKNTNFTLDTESYRIIQNNIKEYQKNKTKKLNNAEFNWPPEIKSSSLLTKQFNLEEFMRLFTNFDSYVSVYFHNLHSVDFDLFNEPTDSITEIYLINSDLRFTSNGKPVKSCGDLSATRKKTFNIHSLFQIMSNKRKWFYLFGCRFPLTLCPFVFYRTSLKNLCIFDLVETFYKTNLMKFSNDTFEDLNSTIIVLYIFHSENLELNIKFLNPFVFEKLESIYVTCSVSSISVDLFARLKSLARIEFETVHYRKLIHRNGIEWIKSINRGLHVNLSNLTDFINNSEQIKYVLLNAFKGSYIEPMSRVFPDEDFCIYKDFPFEQMVFNFQFCHECFTKEESGYLKTVNPSYSCTYLWITQHYHLFGYIFSNGLVSMNNLFIFLNSDSYKNRNSCDFQKRISLCNRSDYHLKNIWGPHDYYLLNKKIQIGVKILIYIVSLFSISTNILVIRIIFAKHNKHVFKDFKHYTYLGLISVFSLSISVIEIVSWLSECFYPFEVFCLGVHKTIVAQLFKMVVKECLVITLRFLSNFCYIAFAICRIALIGRDHNKLIKFMSDVTIWKYVLCSLVFSIVFSWIKYFKYSMNYGYGELNYPIRNEHDISSTNAVLPLILDFYMVFNVISDFLNYLVFVIVCFIVDLGMLVKLRFTLNESINRIASIALDEKQFEKKKSEMEVAMKKSIRMVIVNTSIGLLFKLPFVFLPLLNAIAKFYYKKNESRYKNLGFDRFYSQLFQTDFYSLIQDSTELFYLIAISIQFFIYKKFDNKFKEGRFSHPKNKITQK